MQHHVLEPNQLRSPRGLPLGWPVTILLRSLYPFLTIALLLGTVVWGPWGTLVGSILVWNVITRCA